MAKEVLELEILEPVDELPVRVRQNSRGGRPSKWDAVAEKAILNPGKYIPVKKPTTFSPKWMRKRYPQLTCNVADGVVYVKYEPDVFEEGPEEIEG